MIPEILSTQDFVTVNEGQQTVFTCNATGIPAPEITWFRDGSPFDQNEDERVTLNPPITTEPNTTADLYQVVRNLTLNNTTDSDSGNYTCVADNMNIVQQDATFPFMLFVRGMAFILASMLSY